MYYIDRQFCKQRHYIMYNIVFYVFLYDVHDNFIGFSVKLKSVQWFRKYSIWENRYYEFFRFILLPALSSCMDRKISSCHVYLKIVNTRSNMMFSFSHTNFIIVNKSM